MAAATDPAPATRIHVPTTLQQVGKLTRYQLREYLRSLRFIALLAIVLGVGALLTAIVGHFRGSIVSTNVAFYGSFWGGGAGGVCILAALFFGGDAIAGEFQNKTGYFLMGLPVRRATVYVGKFIAVFLASVAILLVFLVLLLGNGLYYFGTGAFPWQLGLSIVLALVYLSAVLGTTFLFSSLFKTSAYGFVMTAVLFFFGFTILGDLIVGLVKIEPWMIISYASSTIGSVFSSNVNWGLHGTVSHGFAGTSYGAGVAEGIVIMLGYLVGTAVVGLVMFEREEFT